MAAPIHNIGDPGDSGKKLPTFPHTPPANEAEMMENLDMVDVTPSSDAGHMVAQIKSSGASFETLHLLGHCLQSGVVCPELTAHTRQAIGAALGGSSPLKTSSDLGASLYKALASPLFSHWNREDIRDQHTLQSFVSELSSSKSAPAVPEIFNPGLKNALCQLAGPEHAHTDGSDLPSPHTLGSPATSPPKPDPWPPTTPPQTVGQALTDVNYWCTTVTNIYALSLQAALKTMDPNTKLAGSALQAYAAAIEAHFGSSAVGSIFETLTDTVGTIWKAPTTNQIAYLKSFLSLMKTAVGLYTPDQMQFITNFYNFVTTKNPNMGGICDWLKENTCPVPSLLRQINDIGFAATPPKPDPWPPTVPPSTVQEALSEATYWASIDPNPYSQALLNALESMDPNAKLPGSAIQAFGATLEAMEGSSKVGPIFEMITDTVNTGWTPPTTNNLTYLQSYLNLLKTTTGLFSTSDMQFINQLSTYLKDGNRSTEDIDHWLDVNPCTNASLVETIKDIGYKAVAVVIPVTPSVPNPWPPNIPQTVGEALSLTEYWLTTAPNNPFIKSLLAALQTMPASEQINGSALQAFAATLEPQFSSKEAGDLKIFEAITDTPGTKWSGPTTNQVQYLQAFLTMCTKTTGIFSSDEMSALSSLLSYIQSGTRSVVDISHWLIQNFETKPDLASSHLASTLKDIGFHFIPPPGYQNQTPPQTVQEALAYAEYDYATDPTNIYTKQLINILEQLNPDLNMQDTTLSAVGALIEQTAGIDKVGQMFLVITGTWLGNQTSMSSNGYLNRALTLLLSTTGIFNAEQMSYMKNLDAQTGDKANINPWLEQNPCPNGWYLQNILVHLGFQAASGPPGWPPLTTPKTVGDALVYAKYWLQIDPTNKYAKLLVTTLESLDQSSAILNSPLQAFAAEIEELDGVDNVGYLFTKLTGTDSGAFKPETMSLQDLQSFIKLLINTQGIFSDTEMQYFQNLQSFMNVDLWGPDIQGWLYSHPCPIASLTNVLNTLGYPAVEATPPPGWPPTSTPATAWDATVLANYLAVTTNPPNHYIIELIRALRSMPGTAQIMGSILQPFGVLMEDMAKPTDLGETFRVLTGTEGSAYTPKPESENFLKLFITMVANTQGIFDAKEMQYIQKFETFLNTNPDNNQLITWLDQNPCTIPYLSEILVNMGY
ncbi:MAG: hypothetical protein SP1CHLAM54_14230 [Chlamydiia bacterium]|nr:hypothetical protein [Chlamydiia bacterium]MCH9616315.1 hypothetical protein [Chlamydiia bacterium]MCH9629699.1 hypothetical protein [Chlamydiia bacterium]